MGLSPTQMQSYLRSQTAARQYLDKQKLAQATAQRDERMAALRFQALQDYQDLIKTGMDPTVAYRRLAPLISDPHSLPAGLAKAPETSANRYTVKIPADPATGTPERRVTPEQWTFEQNKTKADQLLKDYASVSSQIEGGRTRPFGIGRTSYTTQQANIAKQLENIGFDVQGNVIPGSQLHRQIATDESLVSRLGLPGAQTQVAAPVPETAYSRWLASVGGPGRPSGVAPRNVMYWVDQSGQRHAYPSVSPTMPATAVAAQQSIPQPVSGFPLSSMAALGSMIPRPTQAEAPLDIAAVSPAQSMTNAPRSTFVSAGPPQAPVQPTIQPVQIAAPQKPVQYDPNTEQLKRYKGRLVILNTKTGKARYAE